MIGFMFGVLLTLIIVCLILLYIYLYMNVEDKFTKFVKYFIVKKRNKEGYIISYFHFKTGELAESGLMFKGVFSNKGLKKVIDYALPVIEKTISDYIDKNEEGNNE